MIDLRLDLIPVPKGRPRSTKTGRIYTPKRTADYERSIASMVSHLPAQLGALSLEVTFILKRPVRTPKALTNRFIKAGSRGDLDNYVKSLVDGCQRGGLIPNDSAVTNIKAAKVYAALDEAPHIELRLESLGELVLADGDEL